MGGGGEGDGGVGDGGVGDGGVGDGGGGLVGSPSATILISIQFQNCSGCPIPTGSKLSLSGQGPIFDGAHPAGKG